MQEKANPRLRELAPAPEGARRWDSRNLAFIFSCMSVLTDADATRARRAAPQIVNSGVVFDSIPQFRQTGSVDREVWSACTTGCAAVYENWGELCRQGRTAMIAHKKEPAFLLPAGFIQHALSIEEGSMSSLPPQRQMTEL